MHAAARGQLLGDPQVKDAAPVPVGRHPGLLVEADLPPVPGIDEPWAGTEPAKAKENVAATRCDNTDFSGSDFSQAFTRTFVIPAATQLPAEFGLSETVGALASKQAQPFIDDIRAKLKTCPESDLGTDVERLAQERAGPATSRSGGSRRGLRRAARCVPDGRGPLRNAVGQLAFVPSDEVTIGPEAFVTLARRAQERLAQLATGLGRVLADPARQGEGRPRAGDHGQHVGHLRVVGGLVRRAEDETDPVALGEAVREARELDVDRLTDRGRRHPHRRDQPVDQRGVAGGIHVVHLGEERHVLAVAVGDLQVRRRDADDLERLRERR